MSTFRKEFAISAQAPVGKKDLKSLRKDVAAQFPRLSEKELDVVLPFSGEWNSLKLKQSGTVLYQLTGKPVAFFDLEGRGDIYPSVFTLWTMPGMLETIETHAPVSKHLLKGADLMLPGIVVPASGLPAFEVGAKIAVRVSGNASPVAVGTSAVSSAEAAASGMKGKGMLVTHVYRDSLWSFGGRAVPNGGFKTEEVEACEGGPPDVVAVTAAVAAATVADESSEEEEEEAVATGGGAAAGGGADAGGEAAVVEKLGALSMDDLLLETFLNAALTTLADDKVLPLDAADCYQKHMQISKPAAVQLDAKRSTYKQVAKFFKAQQKAKLITTKEHKGEIKIITIERTHTLLVAHTPSWPLTGSASAAASAATGANTGDSELNAELAALTRSAPPQTSELMGPTHYLEKLFVATGFSKSTLLSRDEAFEKVLFAYMETNGLERKQGAAATVAATGGEEEEDWEKADGEAKGGAVEGEVRLDEMLVESLFKVAGGKKKGEEYPTSASMDDCESRFESRLQPWFRVDIEGFAPRERKGTLPKVCISAGRAAGHNKTSVSGLEGYRIDPDELARYGKRLFNCTASVAELPGKNVHEKEVTFQGHCISELIEHLQSIYKLPRDAIEVKR